MAKDFDRLLGEFDAENTGGFLSGFLAEEDQFDRHSLWRLGSWGAAAVGTVVAALLVNQSSITVRRDRVAAADLARQSQQIQSVAKESQNETRRLASAIDTLNGDRDRLYSRVTVLEQGLDSVTGAIGRQNSPAASSQATPAPSATTEPQTAAQNPATAQVVVPAASTQAKTTERPPADAPVPGQGPAAVASVGQGAANTPAATPATPLMASKSMLAPPDVAAGKLIEPEALSKTVTAAPVPASARPADNAETDAPQGTSPKVAVQRTEFGIDVGGANSLNGLRALWRGLLKSRSNAGLTALRPIVVVKEGNAGLGLQLRLVAGPLNDAAAAARICAALIEGEKTCETTVFDGQRLSMKADEPGANDKPVARKRSNPKRVTNDEPPKKPEPSTMSSLFGH